MDASGSDTVEVREDVLTGYNETIDDQIAGTVWNTGCKSWYLDRNGRNATIWPDFTFRFWGRMRRFDPRAYALTGARESTAAEPALAPA